MTWFEHFIWFVIFVALGVVAVNLVLEQYGLISF